MRSLKGRLIGVATIWIAIGMIAAGFLLSSIFRQHVTEQFYEELYVHLDELQRLAQINADGTHLQRHLSDPRYDVALSGFYWQIERAGSVIARSASLQDKTLHVPKDEPEVAGVHKHEFTGPSGRLLVVEQIRALTPSSPPVHFAIGTDERHLNGVLHHFDKTLASSLAGFGISMVIAASLLILYAMKPFDHLRAALGSVRSGQEKALSGDFPSEVQPLADDLNALLASTSELITRARTQAGNLAHGLKTPLAILTDEAYRIDAQGLPQSSAVILEQSRKMLTQIDYQTTRARAVAMRASLGTVASAAKAASDVASALSRMYRDRELEIETTIDDDVRVACEAQDLNEMLANLVDNACKNAKSTVLIRAGNGPSVKNVLLFVEDDGPGLPPEAYEVVFNIGERWDTQTSGTGLGLAIVRDLARLYGGDVRLDTSSLGGLCVTLELPRPSA